MVKKIEQWEVAGRLFGNEEDALLFEAELILSEVLQSKDVLAVSYLTQMIQIDKRVWIAFKEYIGATEHLHEDPPPRRIFEVGEVSEAFEDEPTGELELSEKFRVVSIGDETP